MLRRYFHACNQLWRKELQWYNARLMSRDFPDWVKTEKAAAARREFAGTMPIRRLDRLADMIADPGESEIAFELLFSHDDQRQVRVEVRVRGQVPLICQRSLKIFEHELDSHSVVGLITDEREADALPDDYEPLLVSEGRIKLATLIEEEMLLALPLVPVDPESERIGSEAPPADTHRPFAELAKLKTDRDRD